MNEYLVEWALLREKNYLQSCMPSIRLDKKVCEQFTTKYGRIDFAHKIKDDGFLITELETRIDSTAKLCYCIEQVKSYKQIRFNNTDNHSVAILYAKQTSDKYKKEVHSFCINNQVISFLYDLEKVRQIYEIEIEKSLMNTGVPLEKPVAMNLTHLSAFNRLMLVYHMENADKLTKNKFKVGFESIGTGKNETVFDVTMRGAIYFDLIIKEKNEFILTELGERFKNGLNFIEGLNPQSRYDLSIEQKRIMIESLLNGNFYERKSKVNIYHFLKFVSLTEGEWLPRGRKFDSRSKLEFVNSFFKMNYREGVAADLLKFSCNHCIELDFVEKIKTTGFYDRVRLTSLGSRILSYLDFDIQLKREKVQIPLQVY
jgi:hypothetical protein